MRYELIYGKFGIGHPCIWYPTVFKFPKIDVANLTIELVMQVGVMCETDEVWYIRSLIYIPAPPEINYSGSRLMGSLWDLDKLIPLTE